MSQSLAINLCTPFFSTKYGNILIFFLCSSAVKLKIDVETMEPTGHNTLDRTPLLTVESEGSRNVGQHGASVVPVSSGQNQSSGVNAEAPRAPMYIPTREEVLRSIAANYMQTTSPASRDEYDSFLTYLKGIRATIKEEEHKADKAYFEKDLSEG